MYIACWLFADAFFHFGTLLFSLWVKLQGCLLDPGIALQLLAPFPPLLRTPHLLGTRASQHLCLSHLTSCFVIKSGIVGHELGELQNLQLQGQGRLVYFLRLSEEVVDLVM